MEFPKLLYRDGNLALDFIEVEDAEQEAQGNAEGFFFYQTHQKVNVDVVQSADEIEETAEEEISERAMLRAAYLEKFGKAAPGRMSDDNLRAALAEE